MNEKITKTTESRAARAVISAQETTRPQALCTRARRSFIILNACFLRLKFGGAFCSLGPLADPSNSTDASHP